MAEIIGAIASVSSLIQISAQVTAIAYNYLSQVRGAKKEIQHLISELGQLSGVLLALKTNCDQNNESHAALLSIDRPPPFTERGVETAAAGPLESCKEMLEGLMRKLEPPKGKLARLGTALMWPLEKKETLESINRIERLKNLFTMAMTADQSTMLDEIKKYQHETYVAIIDTQRSMRRNQETVERIELVVKKNEQWREDFELQRQDSFRSSVLKWISMVDAESNHRSACELKQAGTGEWFLQGGEFENHVSAEESYMWLHGIPGAGKTILMSSIISKIQRICANPPREKNTGLYNLAYFYFDFKDPQKQTVENMIRSLLRQFVQLILPLPAEIEELYERFSTQRHIPEYDLKVALVGLLQGFGKTFINLDALDECTEVEKLIDFIEWLKSQRSIRVQFLATGRRDSHIEERLNQCEFLSITIQGDSVQGDVKRYVEDTLAADPKLRKLKADVKTEVVNVLVSGAKGMFRWVKCQLDSIKSCRTPKSILSALENLPKTLDETYEQALLKINPHDEIFAIRAFQWLALNVRPLTVDQLAEAVIVEDLEDEIEEECRLHDPTEILDICGNLVTMDDRTRVVGLAHFSVQEYLLSERARCGKAAKFAINEREGHEQLLTTCLTYLQLNEFDVNIRRRNEKISQYPLSFYSANFWFYHAKYPEIERKVYDLGPKLFGVGKTKCYNNWMQLFTRRPHGLRVKKRPQFTYPDPLFTVCGLGLVSTANTMIKMGAEVNGVSDRMGTPLIAAAESGNLHTAEMLLQLQADTSTTDQDGRTALHKACKTVDGAMVRLLLKHGADPLAKDNSGWQPLHILCTCVIPTLRRGNIEDVVVALIEVGVPLTPLPDNRTPLVLAAQSRNADAAWALLSVLKSLPEDDPSGKTMLHWASFCGHVDVVRSLLQDGHVDVNARDPLQRTPLHDAVDMGHLPVVEELVHRGNADLIAQDYRFQTPIAVAALRGNMIILSRLLQYKKVEQEVLNIALASSVFARRSLEIAKFLLDQGASANSSRSSIGRTVLQLAVQRDHKSLIDMLRSYGGEEKYFRDKPIIEEEEEKEEEKRRIPVDPELMGGPEMMDEAPPAYS